MRSSFRLCLAFLPLLALAACHPPMDDVESAGMGMAVIGRKLQEKGEIGGAIDFYRRALKNDPKNLVAIKGLAATLEQWGDKEGALAVLQDGVGHRPKDIDLRRNYGRLLIAMDRPADAKAQYDAALDLDSDDVKARTGLGVALDYLGEHSKAQKQYEKALRSDSKNLATLNNLAYSYILSRRFDMAIKTLEPQLNNPAATAALRQNLALAYGLSGMEADAERIAKRDLTPEKVAQNMEYYRRQRAELKIDTAPYAELGTYATEAMAVTQIHKMRGEVEKTGGDLKAIVVPELANPGGTPRFAVRMLGCKRPDDVSRLCETLGKAGIPCVARGKGGE